MGRHDQMLLAFLAGDLEPEAALSFDEHLLGCEDCWRAIRQDQAGRAAAELLRQPAPARLADRIRLAVELAAAVPPQRRRARRRSGLRWGVPAGAGVLAAGVAAVAIAVGAHGGGTPEPAAVAAVIRYAEAMPGPGTARPAAPVAVGHPVTETAGGQRVSMRAWRLGSAVAVVALSAAPFPMPPGARGMSSTDTGWSARIGRLNLYCLNGPRPEIVAGAVPVPELARLARLLPAS